jgi:hypothetical protein
MITDLEAYIIIFIKSFVFVAWVLILPLLAAVMVRLAMRLTRIKVSPAFWLGVGCALMVNTVVLVYELRLLDFVELIHIIYTGMILIGFLIYAFASRAARFVTSSEAIFDFANGYWPVTAVQIYWFLYCPTSSC